MFTTSITAKKTKLIQAFFALSMIILLIFIYFFLLFDKRYLIPTDKVYCSINSSMSESTVPMPSIQCLFSRIIIFVFVYKTVDFITKILLNKGNRVNIFVVVSQRASTTCVSWVLLIFLHLLFLCFFRSLILYSHQKNF